jgi:hypothetical protein
MQNSEQYAWMQAFNRYPLPEDLISNFIEIENPARDYHPALDIIYPDKQGCAWVAPFVLQKGKDCIIPLWVPLKFEAGRFRVNSKKLTPWVPSILCLPSKALSPWISSGNHFNQLISVARDNWSDKLPKWGEFYHRALTTLEECARTPWHHFFQRHGWEQKPARLFFESELNDGKDNSLAGNHKIINNNLKIDFKSLSGKSTANITEQDFNYLATCLSLDTDQIFAIHTQPGQSKDFISHIVASKVVKSSLTDFTPKVSVYSASQLEEMIINVPVVDTKTSLNDLLEDFNRGVQFLEDLSVNKNEAISEIIATLKSKISKYQKQDADLEQELTKWQDIYRQCEKQMPHTWSEKIKFVHKKKETARNDLVQKLCVNANVPYEKILYSNLPQKIREIKVSRHKIHKHITILADKQCTKEGIVKKFYKWGSKYIKTIDDGASIEKIIFEIYSSLGEKLFSAACAEYNKKSIPELPLTKNGFYNVCIEKDNVKLIQSGVKHKDLLIVVNGHLIGEYELKQLQSEFDRIILLGNFFSQDYYLPECSTSNPSAIQFAMNDNDELPIKLQFETILKLNTNNQQSAYLNSLATNMLLYNFDENLTSNNSELNFINIQGKSNISDMHYCNIPEVEAIKKYVSQLEIDESKETLAIVTPFYEQCMLLQSSLPDIKVYTPDTLPDHLFDCVIFSPVYDATDKRPYLFDEGSNMFYNIISHARNQLVIIGCKKIFDSKLNTASAILTKYIDRAVVSDVSTVC